MNLRARHLQAELMDAPDLDSTVHQRALRALGRINALSFSSQIVWPAIHQLSKANRPRPLRVLDLACGGGDMICRLGRRAKRAKLQIEWSGCDRSPVAIRLAQESAAKAGVAAQFAVRDVLQDGLPTDCDVVMCSLFLHHLSEPDAISLLRQMSAAAGSTALVNDLRRTRWGYALAWLGCHLLTGSGVVHVDGPRSVAGAFTDDEAMQLASQAGWLNSRLARHWPQRFLLRWDRP